VVNNKRDRSKAIEILSRENCGGESEIAQMLDVVHTQRTKAIKMLMSGNESRD
jgi:hypothetical protein